MKLSRISLTLGGLAVGICLVGAEVPVKIPRESRRVQELVAQRRTREAVNLLRKALTDKKRNVQEQIELRFMKAALEENIGRPDEAVLTIEPLLELPHAKQRAADMLAQIENRQAAHSLEMASLLFAEQRYPQALGEAEAAFYQSVPGSRWEFDALFLRYMILMESRRDQEAVKLFDEFDWAKVSPRLHFMYLSQRAEDLIHKRNVPVAEAIAACDAAYAIAETSSERFVINALKVEAYGAEPRWHDEAVALAVSMLPDRSMIQKEPESYFAVLREKVRIADIRREALPALAQLREARSFFPKNAAWDKRFQVEEARLLVSVKKTAQAVGIMKGIFNTPELLPAEKDKQFWDFAGVLEEKKAYGEAATAFLRLSQQTKNPDLQRDALFRAAKVYAFASKPEQADSIYERIVNLKNMTPVQQRRVRYGRVELWIACNDFERAEALLQQIMDEKGLSEDDHMRLLRLRRKLQWKKSGNVTPLY